MSKEIRTSRQRQSVYTEEFLYYFLRVRKDRVRKTVKRLVDQYPDETPKQTALRIIGAKTQLSFIGGTLTHLPMLLPGIGQAFKFLGFVGAASMMTRMHLSLILEIALLYGKDIDDKARLPEIAAVVAAVGLGAVAPFLVRVLELNPLYALPAGAISAAAVTRIVGESAIRLYEKKGDESLPEALHA
ncbi:MAG: hypothetical protein V1792_28610 [Pseudomonadota bacterium]